MTFPRFVGRRTICNIVIAAVALFLFGATFRTGIDRGMDQLLSWNGYGRTLQAIATVMTEQQFQVGGYALSNCIFNELERLGLTANPELTKQIGVTFPQNLHSAVFLDKILDNVRRDLPTL